ncbi:unnamed protein product [Larinioides sclopetarius]|uniref:Uncharacterized protein n=1 Tax=Larinioides sclopetarius TaxID=280406 RepID=A0AAV2AD95_9ARAC
MALQEESSNTTLYEDHARYSVNEGGYNTFRPPPSYFCAIRLNTYAQQELEPLKCGMICSIPDWNSPFINIQQQQSTASAHQRLPQAMGMDVLMAKGLATYFSLNGTAIAVFGCKFITILSKTSQPTYNDFATVTYPCCISPFSSSVLLKSKQYLNAYVSSYILRFEMGTFVRYEAETREVGL